LGPVELLSAVQGGIGIELARQHRPDVVLLDLHLPDLPGERVLADLRSDWRTRDIPVVILSADATERQVERLLAAGAHSYLTKPIDVRRFLEVVEEQLRFAGIRDRFVHVVSADEVRRLKPAPEPYRHAAERAGTDAGGLRLVAAHAWDISGALAAGCAAAFVKRPGMTLDPAGERPDVEGNDLIEVAEEILKRDR